MHHIETLNKILKDELSATEMYHQALDKLRDDVGLDESESLRPIYENHKDVIFRLQALIIRLGGTPCEVSEARGNLGENNPGWKLFYKP